MSLVHTMYNSTSKVLPYSAGKMKGVILPGSSKVLNSTDIDNKIKSIISHIEHLNGQLSHRSTHGGKAYRRKQQAIKNQESLATKQLDLLQIAKTAIPKASAVEAMLATAAATASMVSRAHGTPEPVGLSTSGEAVGWRNRTIQVIRLQY